MPNDMLVLWLDAFRDGDESAASELWKKLFPSLVELARKRLSRSPKRVNDEEDIALSVFAQMCENVDRTTFKQLGNDDDLWNMLARMTANRVIDRHRAENSQKRGGGRIRGDSVFEAQSNGGFDLIQGETEAPDFEQLLVEEHKRLLQMLPDDRLRQIAVWRLEGFTQKEIAAKTSLSERSIERKVGIIKDLWRSEMGAE